jgi:hypothetical protein
LPALAANLVRRRVTVLATTANTPAALAAKAAGRHRSGQDGTADLDSIAEALFSLQKLRERERVRVQMRQLRPRLSRLRMTATARHARRS